MFRTFFTTLRALLKSGPRANQLYCCIVLIWHLVILYCLNSSFFSINVSWQKCCYFKEHPQPCWNTFYVWHHLDPLQTNSIKKWLTTCIYIYADKFPGLGKMANLLWRVLNFVFFCILFYVFYPLSFFGFCLLFRCFWISKR